MIRLLTLLATSLALSPIMAVASEADASQRLAYLERSLDASRASIRLWQDGWTTVYGMAAITYTAMALDTDDSDDRTLHSLGALRAALATTLLTIRPHPGRDGADPVRAMGNASLDDRLAAAERLLRDSAHRTQSKRRPARHLRNVLLNLGFGGLVWALGNKDDALPFTLMGIAGGEAVLLTLPEQPRHHLDLYKKQLGYRAPGERTWRLVARPGGLGVQFALQR
jgi:hypothetical protein